MRITSTLFKGTAENVINAAKQVWFPPLLESMVITEDISEMARRRKMLRYALFDMQTYLAHTLQAELIGLKHWREEKDLLGDSEEVRMMEQFARMTVNALEQVANGIAYRFFDYNHTLVQSLHRQQTSTYNILSDGFWNSVEVASAYNDLPVSERQILLSDLNNLTSIGDFVVKDADSYEIVEVKLNKSASGRKVSRQKAKLREIVDFLSSASKRVDELEVETVTLPARKHQLSVLAEILEEAERTGMAVAHVNSYASIGVITISSYKPEECSKKMEELLERVENGRDQANLFTLTSMYIRDKSSIVAPFTIFPIPSSQIVDVLFGRKIVFFCLDLEVIKCELERAGWNVTRIENAFTRSPEKFNVFLLWEGSVLGKNLGVPIDVLVSCAVELMNLNSYISMLKTLWKNGDDGVKRHSICFYEDETRLWN